MHGLVLRQPFRLDGSRLDACPPHTQAGSPRTLYRYAACLPSFLYAADRALSSKAAVQSLREIVQSLCDLDQKLTGWFGDFRRGKDYALDKEGSLRYLEAGLVWQFKAMSPNELFGPLLRFVSFQNAHIHSLYWQCLLLLRSTLQLLMAQVTWTAHHPRFSALRGRDLRAEVQACANLLCRSIPFLLSSAGGNTSKAAAIRAPLLFARECFARSGQFNKLEWCEMVEAESRAHFATLDWEFVLPWSLLAIIWQPS